MSTSTHAPSRRELTGGLDHGTLVAAGVATLGLIVAVLDTTIVNVALDTLFRDLNAGLGTGQWISTGYLLALAIVIPLSGWITERFGSKRTWITSLALFGAGSALCGLASSVGELIALIAIAVAARALAPDAGHAEGGAGRLDWLGAVLLCPGLGGIVFGLSQVESHGGLSAPAAVGPLVAGVALIALFAWHSHRVPRALIDLQLFRRPGFRAAATLTFLLGAALFGTLLALPLYFQLERGQSALGSPRRRGIGLGASIQPATAAAYATLTADAVPRATAALNTLRQIGGSIGTALLAVVLQHEDALLPAIALSRDRGAR
jgi:MFS family permease